MESTRFEISASDLYAIPLRFLSTNKKAIYEHLAAAASTTHPTLTVAQYRLAALAPTLSLSTCTSTILPGPYTYTTTPDAVDWWMNFADANLFGYYHTNLFAQDEVQVTECPVLAHVREYLKVTEYFAPRTRGNNSSAPTPVLIHNAERMCHMLTAKKHACAPLGIYGNRMASVPTKALIQHFVQVIQPPQLVNIVCMEAPRGGHGTYTTNQVMDILKTAVGAFQATKIESGSASSVVVHGGNWGCGAYGGNVTMMAILQLFAAKVAGVHYVAHAMADVDAWQQAQQFVEAHANQDVHAFVQAVLQLNLSWGYGNGT